MHSPDLVEDNIRKLAKLFPHCLKEDKDDNGTLKKSIDFDLLRQELSDSIVEGSQERYHLDWPGKREALLTANAPIAKTLRPCREESVDFDTTQNLFIEGDNLDALKLLQETYLGKIKMIYIDPPYNTGNDFIYEDNFDINKAEYEQESGQRDEEGGCLIANLESNGRFHSDWLSMMYSRLRLGKNLLSDNGVIFIQIDDNEVHNLRKLCDEVFGEDNFVSTICVQMSYVSGEKMAHIDKKPPKIKEFIHIYAKNKSRITLKPISQAKEISKEYNKFLIKNNSDDPKDWQVVALKTHLKKLGLTHKKDISEFMYDNAEYIFNRVRNKNKEFLVTRNIDHPVKLSTATGLEKIAWHGREAIFLSSKIGKDEQGNPVYWEPLGDIWTDINITNIYQEGDIDFKNGKKPLKLLKRLVDYITNKDDIVVDFFGGSSTTAHAVMQLNQDDGGNRKCIIVQLPEQLDSTSKKKKDNKLAIEFCDALGIPRTVAEIGKERIRRAGKKIKEENPSVSDLDIGFRVLKVDSSNMADVYYTPDAVDQGMLTSLVDNIKADRTEEDLLFQVLLDWGVDLSLPITEKTIHEHRVFFVDTNALAACFASGGEITEEFCKELAHRKPLRVVFRDSGFKDSTVKINVEQIFKLISPHTDVKCI